MCISKLFFIDFFVLYKYDASTSSFGVVVKFLDLFFVFENLTITYWEFKNFNYLLKFLLNILLKFQKFVVNLVNYVFLR